MYEKSRLFIVSSPIGKNNEWIKRRFVERGTMEGTLKSLIVKKQFGFIRAKDGKEYFMHKSEFRGHWNDLVIDHHNDEVIKLTFDIVLSERGPRATNVVRTEHPNEGTK